MNPTDFIPNKPDDFVGSAHKTASVLWAKALHAKSAGATFKVLLYGHPGTGKTRIAEMIARLLAGHELAVEDVNGKQVTIDVVRNWMGSIAYSSLFGDWTVKIVNELDLCSQDAQNLLLTYLDKLPPKRAFIGTSNMQLDMLAERFQTRLQQFQVLNCTTDELQGWLVKRWCLPVPAAKLCAVGSGGNVRAALLDAQNYLDATRFA